VALIAKGGITARGLIAVNRFAPLHRVHACKTPRRRARRIAEFVNDLGRGVLPAPATRGPGPAHAAA
jgi:hypothetical protein